jgi:predicted  nucleic acid-binding Zn-ribbon protein
MAWGSKKEQLIAEFATAQAETRMLREMLEYKDHEITELRGQLHRTQEALIAKEAPEAYIDHKIEQDAAKPMTDDQKAKQKQARSQSEMDQKLVASMEGPLFIDADDMQAMLMPALMKPQESLHGDGES